MSPRFAPAPKRSTRRRGFTLVELVVVVLILGIIAAVAAPKLFSTAGDARISSAKQSLAVIRDGIELYRSQDPNGAYPPVTSDAAFKTAMKPYVRGNFPNCPIGNANATVGFSTTTPLAPTAGTEGWLYNGTTGEFIVNSASAAAY